MKQILSWNIILLILFANCERVNYFPDNPREFDSTKIIAHRGGGYFDEGNTLYGCIYGLNNFNGIECDIQISQDGTIWLSHSGMVPSCGTYSTDCFASSSDKRIIDVDSCLGNKKDFTKLEEVFAYMAENFPQKHLSLDVKTWEPCEFSGMNLIGEMNTFAQKIIDLSENYHLEKQILVESENGDFLYYMKTHSNEIETYLATNGDFELGVSRALNAGFTGISFKYGYLESLTTEKIELIRKKGLKIQVWTVNGKEEFQKVLSMKPDYIQTDEKMNF